MTDQKEKIQAFEKLLEIMDDLSAQCPWDKEQTFESLRHLTIEETYELSEAVLDKDIDSIKKELGDLMLHLFFMQKLVRKQIISILVMCSIISMKSSSSGIRTFMEM